MRAGAGINVENLCLLCGVFIGVQHVSTTLTSRTGLIQRAAQMWLFLLPPISEADCLHHHVKAVRSIFIFHYVKSRSDLFEEWPVRCCSPASLQGHTEEGWEEFVLEQGEPVICDPGWQIVRYVVELRFHVVWELQVPGPAV